MIQPLQLGFPGISISLNVQLLYEGRVASKVAGVKVYPIQTWNFRSHAISAWSNHVIGPQCHRCQWLHRPMHSVIAWALLFRFHLGYTRYFGCKRQTLLLILRQSQWRRMEKYFINLSPGLVSISYQRLVSLSRKKSTRWPWNSNGQCHRHLMR